MPTNPKASDKAPAKGSRETIDDELKKVSAKPRPAGASRPIAQGDEAPPGTPGTGEDVCPAWKGSGQLAAKPCPNCDGSGRIVKAIGGA